MRINNIIELQSYSSFFFIFNDNDYCMVGNVNFLIVFLDIDYWDFLIRYFNKENCMVFVFEI